MSDAASPDTRPMLALLVLRTALLVTSLVLLFPDLLGRLTGGAWPRFVTGLGSGRWVAWGACFVGMAIARFAGGPLRKG